MNTHTESLPPQENQPAGWSDLTGRLVVCSAMILLLFALWSPRLEYAAGWTQKELRILPRMSVFVVSALMALIIRGARPGSRFLLGAGALAIGLCICWLPFALAGTSPGAM